MQPDHVEVLTDLHVLTRGDHSDLRERSKLAAAVAGQAYGDAFAVGMLYGAEDVGRVAGA